jgi:radical SAM-linked protein
LDFLRVFQQGLRRSGLPAAYSRGFNPHMLLSFALPLPLGMASVHDYADLTLAEPVNTKTAAALLQAHMPPGLRILAVRESGERSAAAITAAADYTLKGSMVNDLLAAGEYIIPKKTKSGVKDTDIRPDIFNIEAQSGQITLRLAAGSARFINPMTVAGILLGRSVSPCEITRTELYIKRGEQFRPLYTDE